MRNWCISYAILPDGIGDFFRKMGYPLSPSSLDLPMWKSRSGPEAPLPKSGKNGVCQLRALHQSDL